MGLTLPRAMCLYTLYSGTAPVSTRVALPATLEHHHFITCHSTHSTVTVRADPGTGGNDTRRERGRRAGGIRLGRITDLA